MTDFLKFFVAIENYLSLQRLFGLVSRQRFFVATGLGDGEAEACEDRAPWMCDRTRNRARQRTQRAHSCARYRLDTMHYVEHYLSYCSKKKKRAPEIGPSQHFSSIFIH